MTPARRGHLAMLAFSLLVAGSFSLGGMIAREIAPAALNAMRFAIASGVVAAFVVLKGDARLAYFRAPWRYGILGGLFACYFVLMFEGLKTASPVSTAAVFTLTPVLSAIAGFILLRQITTPRMALALAIGAIGALWVIFRADLAAFLAFDIGRGEAIFFIGTFCHAIYTPMIRKLNHGEPAAAFTLGTLIAGLICLILWGWSDIMATGWLQLPALIWITILYLAICASAMTFVLLQYASLRLPSSKVMAYTYLTPSWVILWEIGLGNSAPSLWILIGVAFCVAALLMLLKDES